MYVAIHNNLTQAAKSLPWFGIERVGGNQAFVALGPIFLNVIWGDWK